MINSLTLASHTTASSCLLAVQLSSKTTYQSWLDVSTTNQVRSKLRPYNNEELSPDSSQLRVWLTTNTKQATTELKTREVLIEKLHTNFLPISFDNRVPINFSLSSVLISQQVTTSPRTIKDQPHTGSQPLSQHV